MSTPKKLAIREFRQLGYLQELNRRFLHPLGLALEVVVNDDGTERLGEVWDSRDDPEGLIFGEDLLDEEAVKRARFVEWLEEERTPARVKELGYWIQPLPVIEPETGS